MQWTTWSFETIIDCSFAWTLGILTRITMWTSYDILIFINIGINMNTLSSSWEIQVIWVKYFFMHKIKCWELAPYVNHFVMWTYNKMLEGFNMQVKWGIWRENGGVSWKTLIQQNQNIHICSKPHLFWLTSCNIEDAWISCMKSLAIKMLTWLIHIVGLRISNYRRKKVLTPI